MKSTPTPRRPQSRRLATSGRRTAGIAVGTAAAGLLMSGQALAAPHTSSPGAKTPQASASPAPTPSGITAGPSSQSVTANLTVQPAISLTIQPPASFDLSGAPGDQPEDLNAVRMDVLTDNPTGYNVTVQATGDLVDNARTTDISANSLLVRESGTSTYHPLSDTAAVMVYSQNQPSAASPGDVLSNDWELGFPIFPSLRPGVYSTTIIYVASVNP